MDVRPPSVAADSFVTELSQDSSPTVTIECSERILRDLRVPMGLSTLIGKTARIAAEACVLSGVTRRARVYGSRERLAVGVFGLPCRPSDSMFGRLDTDQHGAAAREDSRDDRNGEPHELS